MENGNGNGNARYTVDPLDIRAIPHGRRHLIIGKTNTGKTTMLVDILYHRQNILQFGIVIAGSIGSVVEIRKFHPDTFIYEDLNPTILQNFWDRVRVVNGRLRRRNLPMVNFYIVLDDTGFDERMWNNPILKAMMMNGRQYNLDLYMCLQYMKGVTTSMRGQVDYVYIFKEKSPENIKRIYDTFAGGYFENRFVFEAVFRECTLDKRALVVRNSDNKYEEGDFEGGIFFYKAKTVDEHGEFTIGCDAVWKYHLSQYNEHYESDEETFIEQKQQQQGSLSSLHDAPRKKSEIGTIQLRRKKPEPLAQVKTTGN
jgi:hypothetical protein